MWSYIEEKMKECTHDALFIVGALDQALLLRGLRYHPIDLEMSVVRGHKSICER